MNNQYVIPLFVSGSLLLTLFAFFLIAYLIVQKNKQNAYQKNILEAKNEEQKSTMDQISAELHDNVKSVLGFAQMSMYNIAGLATNKEQEALIEETNKIIGDVIDDLHNISHTLSGDFVLSNGLLGSITYSLEHVKRLKQIEYNIDVEGESYPMSSDKEVNIFRIAQEAIQNCRKHANATNINFTLTYAPNRFVMKYSDNGKGFDQSEQAKMKGVGFLNMKKRAKLIEGTLDVQSVLQQGTTITLTLNPNKNGINN